MDAGKIVDVACRPWPNTRAIQAERILARALTRDLSLPLQSRALNARGVWSLVAEPTEPHGARELFQAALAIDPTFHAAAENLVAIALGNPQPDPLVRIATLTLISSSSRSIDPHRGLTLSRMLRREGFNMTAIVARVDNVLELKLDIPHQIIDLKRSVCEPDFQAALAGPLQKLNPDFVLLYAPTADLPHLAAAVSEYPYVLGPAAVDWCPLLENASAQAHESLGESALHFPGPGTSAFDDRMRQAVWDAAEVLVCTPEAQGRLAPHARSVRIVPWGVDPAVFCPAEPRSASNSLALCVVLTNPTYDQEAGRSILRQLAGNWDLSSSQFSIDVIGPPRSLGQTAAEPHERAKRFQDADIIIFPEENPGAEWPALLAESIACGRPVVAPRDKSTQYVQSDGIDGFLFEPAIPRDLPRVIHQLASDARLRHEIGATARRAVLRRFDWKVVVERAYRPILRRKSLGGRGSCRAEALP